MRWPRDINAWSILKYYEPFKNTHMWYCCTLIPRNATRNCIHGACFKSGDGDGRINKEYIPSLGMSREIIIVNVN